MSQLTRRNRFGVRIGTINTSVYAPFGFAYVRLTALVYHLRVFTGILLIKSGVYGHFVLSTYVYL
jgi:hypothetical protein